MSDTRPERPSDRRPNDEPWYIDTECDDCGATLEPNPEAFDLGWYDEFRCDCEGIRMDWPQAEFDELIERMENAEFVPLDEPDFDA